MAGVGSQSLLQGIFPTQGSNMGVLHCRQILYHLSHQGSPHYRLLLDYYTRRLLDITCQKHMLCVYTIYIYTHTRFIYTSFIHIYTICIKNIYNIYTPYIYTHTLYIYVNFFHAEENSGRLCTKI